MARIKREAGATIQTYCPVYKKTDETEDEAHFRYTCRVEKCNFPRYLTLRLDKVLTLKNIIK